jgi:hypothetical protein
VFNDEAVEVGVDEDESWACSPVAQETRLDVPELNLAVKESVPVEENHGYDAITEV